MLKPQAAFHSRIAQIAASVTGRHLKKADDPADDPDDDEDDDEDEPTPKKAKPKKADDDTDDSARRHKATASEIIAAGKARRGEVPGKKPTSSLAAQIIAAGAKRRGEIT